MCLSPLVQIDMGSSRQKAVRIPFPVYQREINISSKPITSHFFVSVFKVRLVPVVVPPFANPASTFPPATGRESLFSPERTVKFARGSSQGFLVATVGDPSDPMSALGVTEEIQSLVAQTKETSRHLVLLHRQDKISPVVPLMPLKHVGIPHSISGVSVGSTDRTGPTT